MKVNMKYSDVFTWEAKYSCMITICMDYFIIAVYLEKLRTRCEQERVGGMHHYLGNVMPVTVTLAIELYHMMTYP